MELTIKSDCTQVEYARKLAAQLGCTLLDDIDRGVDHEVDQDVDHEVDSAAHGWLIDINKNRIGLLDCRHKNAGKHAHKNAHKDTHKNSGAFYLEFKPRYRGKGRSPLMRALGKNVTSVLDLTAGWCVDACAMVFNGIHVTAFENNPLVFELIKFARDNAEPQLVRDNLILIFADGVECVKLGSVADVVFLDPMYPASNRTAASRKGITILKELQNSFVPKNHGESHGENQPEKQPENQRQNEKQLLDAAVRVAGKRVVVKRAHFAPPISEMGKVGEVNSRQVRYDIYAPKSCAQFMHISDE